MKSRDYSKPESRTQVLSPMLLRLEEAAEVLGVSKRVIERMVSQHALPVVRMGASVRIPADGLREWIREQTQEAVSESP